MGSTITLSLSSTQSSFSLFSVSLCLTRVNLPVNVNLPAASSSMSSILWRGVCFSYVVSLLSCLATFASSPRPHVSMFVDMSVSPLSALCLFPRFLFRFPLRSALSLPALCVLYCHAALPAAAARPVVSRPHPPVSLSPQLRAERSARYSQRAGRSPGK